MKRFLKTYLDGWLLLYIALTIGSSVRAAHGAFIFFGFIVDPWLAWLSTVVLALSVIGLDAAAAAERNWWKRGGYIAAAVLFLITETLANYYSGQASFVPRIVAKFAGQSSDILSIAQDQPGIARALVVLFEATPSICVAGFTWASASRVALLRRQQARPLFARLRARVRVWRVQLREMQATIAQQAATAAAEIAQLRMTLASSDEMLASARSDLAQVKESHANELAQAQANFARSEESRASNANVLAQVRTEAEQARTALAQSEGSRANDAAEFATLRTTSEAVSSRFAQLETDHANACEQAAQAERQLASLRTEHAAAVAAAQAEREAHEQERAAAQAQAIPTRAVVVAYLERELAQGRTRSDVARELGFGESTLRAWLPLEAKTTAAISAD